MDIQIVLLFISMLSLVYSSYSIGKSEGLKTGLKIIESFSAKMIELSEENLDD